MTLFRSLCRTLAAGASLCLFSAGLVLADPPRRVFAWLANDPNNTYDNATLAGLREVMTPTGATVETYFAGFNGTTQLAQCRAALALNKYTGLFISAADAVGIIPCVTEAKAKGVPVVATDLPIGPDTGTVQPQVPGQVGASFIPATSWAAAVKSIIPQACAGLSQCNVFYVAGVSSFAIDTLGYAAAQQAVALNSSYRLLGAEQAFYTASTAKQVMLAQFAAHPEINLVVASGDQMALGVEQAAAQLNLTVRIVGAGAGKGAIEAVKQGRWFGTFNALPKTEGHLGAVLMNAHLLFRRAPAIGIDPVVFTGLPSVWTQATLAQYPRFTAQWE
jgi:ribose transport system substrate-binding protein